MITYFQSRTCVIATGTPLPISVIFDPSRALTTAADRPEPSFNPFLGADGVRILVDRRPAALSQVNAIAAPECTAASIRAIAPATDLTAPACSLDA